MYCENCGNRVEDNAKFCSACGAPLKPAHMKKPEEVKAAEEPVQPEEVKAAEEPVQEAEMKAAEEPVQPEEMKAAEEPVWEETTEIPQAASGPVGYSEIGVELPKKNNNKKILIALICLCVVLAGAVAGVLLALNHNKDSSGEWGKAGNDTTVKSDQKKETEANATEDGWTEEDAATYIMACLDASYKGEFSDYIRMTGCSREEAREIYEAGIENTMDESDVEDLGLSQELVDQYNQLFVDLYKSAKYEITNVIKLPNEEFQVEITVWPLAAMQNLEGLLTQELENDPAIQNGDRNMSEAEINQMIYQKMYDIMSAQIGEYGTPVALTVHLELDDDGYYSMPDEDYQAIEYALSGQ